MPEKERNKVDISKYIPYFRRFHLWLGLSVLSLGSIVVWAFGMEAGGVFIGLYPLVAYIFFIWNTPKYTGQVRTGNDWLTIWLLMGCVLFVGGMLIYKLGG